MSDCLLAIFCILLLRIPHFRTLYFIASICMLVDSFLLCIIFFIFIYPFFYGLIADARHFGNLSITLMLFVELIYLFFFGGNITCSFNQIFFSCISFFLEV